VIANLKLAAFVACCYHQTSCPINAPANALHPNNICLFVGLKTAKDAYTEPPAPPVLKRIKQIHEHIENLDAHFLKMLWMTKTLLAYVIREDETVILADLDPANDYVTVQEEMITHMPHTHLAFHADNIKV
jgi:hypothetical protein